MQSDKIAIFYHLYQAKHWERLYQEQINSLIISGLYDKCDFIHIGINGDQELPFVLDKMRVHYNDNKILEANTLQSLWEFCKNNPNYKILYYHSKGVTHLDNYHCEYTTNAWRIYLEYFVLHKWKQCIQDLNEYDCVGAEWENTAKLYNPSTNYSKDDILPHYKGNFWWAKASYINTLDIDYIYCGEKEELRYRSEWWIGTNNPNFKSYHTSGKNLYDFNYSPNYYTKSENMNLEKNEFDIILDEIQSSWKGHKDFSQWIVQKILPETIVDLGVDLGYSSFCFSSQNIGKIYGIDLFEVGEKEFEMLFHSLNQEKVIEYKKRLNLSNLILLKSDFNKIVESWSTPIDILHIDGWHQYDVVKNDFEKWSKFVSDNGVILMHDTCVFDRDFGTHKFFDEIDLPKINFKNSCGLGVVSKNIELLQEIYNTFFTVMDEKYSLV